MRSENLMQFDSNNEKISFPDFDNAAYYICGKKSLELLKCVKWITISNIDTFSNKTVKAGDWNGKPIFYSSVIPENEMIGLNKTKECEEKIVYSSIIG